jgi:heat shock protein HtpX
MEMCIDNPREGFGELFDTHPSVERRISALVEFAGGHDPGPRALPPHDDDQPMPSELADQEISPEISAESEASDERGPWSEPSSQLAPQPGPWGPHRN